MRTSGPFTIYKMCTSWHYLGYVYLCSFICYVDGFYTSPSQDIVCGELLRAGQGNIESPLFPDPYPADLDCKWTITARPGYRISVTSEYFSLESQTNCLYDYITIADGEDGEFGRARYCGDQDVDFLSQHNVITVDFRTDHSASYPGFRLLYEAVAPQSKKSAGCNRTVQSEGVISSPDYPFTYPANVTCFYHVQAPVHQLIVLEFVEFQVETSPCDFDRLEIYNGINTDVENLLGIFCGSDLPVSLQSETSSLILKFVSDKTVEKKGFNATVHFIDDIENTSTTEVSSSTPPPIQTTKTPLRQSTASGLLVSTRENQVSFIGECNVTVAAAISNISSPSYPNLYPLNTVCITRLASQTVSSFLIKFFNFNIEEGDNCTYDSLCIYARADSDHSITEPVLLRCLCGPHLENPIFTWEGQGLDLVFRSDSSVSSEGYWAQVFISPVKKESTCPAECENGGTCTEILLVDGSIDWMCMCPELYTGTLCQTQVKVTCSNVQCENGGTCQEDENDAHCLCPSGFTGRYCEEMGEVTEGGTLYFTKIAGNMSLSPGSNVILECAVNDPTAHVMWLLHDRILTKADWSRGIEVHPGGVVVIPEVRDEHSGRYTCMAITSGDLLERSMWVTLKEPCSLSVINAPSNITVREGQSAMFPCYMPDADVTMWRKDGNLIEQGPRKRVLVNHYLVINQVVETDAGQYTCVARSREGCFSKVSAYLIVETTGHGHECGKPKIKPFDGGSNRISKGREAVYGSAPWHVILREVKKDTTFCGGSLISADTVLTAAHCIGQFEMIFGYPFRPEYIQIFIGTHQCSGHNGTLLQIKNYYLHERYNDTHYNNDIAILKLERSVAMTDNVMPICLETPEFMEELLKPGRLGVITGCGSQFAHGPAPAHLHEVQIPYVLPDICKERAASVNITFTSGMFCAGYSRRMRGDACEGDSGGAYVLEFSGRSVQAGIVSWGVGCDRENHYGYYTHVANYYDWIMEKMKLR
ncbi:uncharacterized protein LOC106071829 isoform X2 [Biomphalaria glabrata]|uniref:Uncharacterized protein LOC106071829 isoform X2 n=1 Tax=Biomphalaria glabrata TaxID=6526 RepID=A0A9W3A322_BIOGL|nr:uncharacterized protein LOC106071829 isoform X2 [Biomphalaria glabrata]